MTVETFDPNEPRIQLSESAKKYVKGYLAKEADAKGLRFTVKKTGCSGYSYVSEMAIDLTDNDLPIVIDDELTVYMDAKALDLINGIIVDFEDQLLGQKKLTYTNPNETARCGCGESFSIVKTPEGDA